MKHTMTLNRQELQEAIAEYLLKSGYILNTQMYGTALKFKLGKLEIGTQREPESIETVVSVECTLM